MSEAVVDDIVAVLPPLLQSLEALGFIARYLNPPDFDRVMAAAGKPDAALRAVRPRLEQWPAEFAHIKTPLETASDAALAAFEGLARRAKRPWRFRQPVSRAAPRPARAGGAVCAGGKIAAGEPVLCRSRAARRRRSRGAAGGAGQRKHRHLPRSQRARQPRRLLALRAGILHARPRMAAGDGAARRQRQWPRLPVELAARRPQPRRDPGRTDRDRQHLGADGRRHRYAEPRCAFWNPCGRAGTSIRAGCC